MTPVFAKHRLRFPVLLIIASFTVVTFGQQPDPYDIQNHIQNARAANAQQDQQSADKSTHAEEGGEAQIRVLDEAQLRSLIAHKQSKSKLAWSLSQAADLALAANAKSAEELSLSGLDPVLRTRNGRIAVDIVVRGDAGEALRELTAMGLENGVAFGRVISGQIPAGELRSLEEVSSIQQVLPAAFETRAGLVTSRGIESMGTDAVTSLYGLSGAGVTLGTLSDSYDCLGGAATDVANNDLPLGVNVLADSCAGDTDEGRAMMQLIHDVAPGSAQAFHTSNGGQAAFAQGIIDLAAVAGCDVIVDDTIYFAEPMFQDGIIAQAVDIVKASGVSYFSSAGNYGRDSYESAYRGSGFQGIFGQLHDFDPGAGVDVLQNYTLGTGLTIFIFQWDQPFFSVSGAPGAQSDMDMLLFFNGSFLGLGGFTVNLGGDAVEVFGINNSGGPVQLQVGIELVAGPAPNLMKYVWSDLGGNSVDEFDTASSTIWGHSNAAGGMAIGGAAWYNTLAWNPFLTSAFLNSSSSAGPTPILFDLAGNPVVEQRDKPDVVGPDGTNTTFFGFDLPFSIPGTNEPDGFPNFFGTSASAPHVAAGAALLLEAVPSLSPDQVYSSLEQWATDMDDRSTTGFDVGFDFATGFGFVDILASLNDQILSNNGKKITICHRPPGNPANARTITVSINALSAHLAHGDKVGPCN